MCDVRDGERVYEVSDGECVCGVRDGDRVYEVRDG